MHCTCWAYTVVVGCFTWQCEEVRWTLDTVADVLMWLQVAAAVGLISGEGLWAVPEAILALAKANPPLCMQFIATSAEKKT